MAEDKPPTSIAHDLFGMAGAAKWGQSITDALFGGVARLYVDKRARTSSDADAYHLKVIGESGADVEAYKIARVAEAQAYASSIVIRAKLEAEHEQLRHQENLEAVARAALEQAPDSAEPSPGQPDPDWMDDFKELARRTNKQDLQVILGRILAGELARPGAYPISVAMRLRQLDRDTLTSFQKFARLRVDLMGVVKTWDVGMQTKYGIDFEDFSLCEQNDLLSGTMSLCIISKPEAPRVAATYNNVTYLLDRRPESKHIPIIGFTRIGEHIARLLQAEPNLEYEQDIRKKFAELMWDIQAIENRPEN